MASHYKLYDGLGEVVPFNARYTYPTQANRAWKQNIKISATNGPNYKPGGSNPQIIFPAQGYLNTRNSFLSFDVRFDDALAGKCNNVRFQNNIQSIFNRMQLRYGSLSVEDLRETGPLVRLLTDNTMTNFNGTLDQNAIMEGVGGNFFTMAVQGVGDNGGIDPYFGLQNTRWMGIQSGGDMVPGAGAYKDDKHKPRGTLGAAGTEARRYQVQLPFGLFQQNKLLPLKWMASQLTVELSLASFEECCTADKVDKPYYTGGYSVENLAFNAELFEFDGSYDAAFLEGLRKDGVPLKFSSWNTYSYPARADRETLQIPERNRSLKAVFHVQTPPKRATGDEGWAMDSHALLQSSNGIQVGENNGGEGIVQQYQFRIGGKYYPAQPVQCGVGDISNGAAEAYAELQKALNIVGDYRLSTGQNPFRWARMVTNNDGSARYGFSSPFDWPTNQTTTSTSSALWGPSSFAIGLDLETSAGAEVSGLNGEEQNDLSLMITYNKTQSPQCGHLVYVYYDALLVLRENNLVELIK